VYPRVYPRRVPPCVPPYVQGRRAREINTAIAEAFEFFGKRSANGMIVPEWVPIPDNLRWGNGRLPKFDVKARTYLPVYPLPLCGITRVRGWRVARARVVPCTNLCTILCL